MVSRTINAHFFVSSLSISPSFFHCQLPPSLVNQGPPHGITPLVGPDTAHSSPLGVRPSQAQRASTLNAKPTDTEATIYRQEMELNRAKSQALALQSQMKTQRATARFVDEQQMDHMVSEDLERAEGDKSALNTIKQTIEKDRADIRDLRMIVCGEEINLRQRQRLAERMLAAARQDTRENKVMTRKVPIAESSTNPVGIACRHIVGLHLTVLKLCR
ncbi:unnamed protein product [Penicillium discolor]